MNVNLRLSEELFDSYVQLDAKNPRGLMEKVLEKFQGQDPGRISLVLGAQELAALGAILGSPVASFSDLKSALSKAVQVSVQDVGEISLSQGQRQRLKDLAKFSGQADPKAYLKSLVLKAVTTIVGP